MPGETDPNAELQIGHILFLDIVGYSKLLTNEQRERVAELTRIVRGTDAFQTADRAGKLMMLPTGDGMVLAFFTSPDAPVRCAIAISSALTSNHALPVRMGIHSGPVEQLTDVTGRPNLTGAGVNMAQRVMDCGDAGHILLSARAADDLAQISDWKNKLHSLGEIEVKHGVRVPVSSLHDGVIGNPEVPQKILWQHKRHRRKLVVVSAVAIATAAAIIGVVWLMRRAAVPPEAKSIAVLPFENLSADKENVFFANGVQDEILTRLAKIASLKVISRTSTRNYPSKPANLGEIAQQLGVAHILEGGVQKVGSKIRVNVQLINATTDTHLWAETYDRELIDAFKVESEVATAIASQLRAVLTPEERTRLQKRPTSNVEAYELYLRARDAQTNGTGIDGLRQAQALYEQALKLDPDFALAHARLSIVHCDWYSDGFEETEAHRIGARVEWEQALQLQPDLGEGYAARGEYFKVIEKDFDSALRFYARARESLPNDPAVLGGIAAIHRRQGHWKQAIAEQEQVMSLDPRYASVLEHLGNSYMAVKRWADAERVKRKAMELYKSPPEAAFGARLTWAWTYFALTGDLRPTHKLLDDLPPDFDPAGRATGLRYDTAMIERDYDAAERAIAACKLNEFDDKTTKSFSLGMIAAARGDLVRARPLFEAELQVAQKQLNENPDAPNRRARVGWVLAYLGRKEEAIREGRKAVELLPESKDAFFGVSYAVNLAQIYALVGERDQALQLIERLLKTPAGLALFELRVMWFWDPLRDDPRFQKILASPDPDIIYN